MIKGADPEAVWDLYFAAKAAIDLAAARVEQALEAGSLAPEPFDSVFPEGTTSKQIRDYFMAQQFELERSIVTALVACFEAMIRGDLHERVTRKCKPPGIDFELKSLWTKRKKRVRLDDVIEAWKTHLSLGPAASQFRQLMQYRHWLAHGQTWKLSVPPTPPDQAWEVGKAFLDAIGLGIPA